MPVASQLPEPRLTERLGMLDFMIHVCQMPREERAEVLGELECKDPAVQRTYTTSLHWSAALATMVADYARLDATLAHPSWAELHQALDLLVPRSLDRVPLDPFTDRPFRYERRGDGYLLASVGQDGRDDGDTDLVQPIVGSEWVTEWTPPETATGTDLVVRLPLPPSPVLQRVRAAETTGR